MLKYTKVDDDVYTCGTCQHGFLYDQCAKCEKEIYDETDNTSKRK